MGCPKCNGVNIIKDGIVKNKQRYLCKLCNYRYTVFQHSTSKSADIKRQALELYLEGLNFRAIGRFLRVSHVAVYNWIKSFVENLDDPKYNSPVKIIELDEMHSYIGSKKNITGYGLLLMDIGKDSSTAYWVRGELQKNSGVQSESTLIPEPDNLITV
ncbi:MAG: IS1 family transposase [Burkholderiales bacterium]|nr:IS1 family transposase [Burkholderiales bacterium]